MVQYIVQKGGIFFMLAVNYSTIRKDLKNYCDKVTEESETVIITRKNEKNVVLLSLEEYNEMIRELKNAEYLKRLNRSIQQAKEGKVIVKSMEELERITNE